MNHHHAIILFGHGSRDPLWHRPMHDVAERVRHMAPHAQVRCAYLEITTPDLPMACAELVVQGVTHITVVPLFLGVGRHAREDLPLILDELRVRYPQVSFVLRPSVGEDPRLLDTLAHIAAG